MADRITKAELVELVDLQRDHIRNDRYRFLIEKFDNDESLDNMIAGFLENDPERLVVDA